MTIKFIAKFCSVAAMAERPQPIAEAWKQVHAWLACEPAWIPEPTERHAELLEEILAQPGWPDGFFVPADERLLHRHDLI
jgi:hypothetical protein